MGSLPSSHGGRRGVKPSCMANCASTLCTPIPPQLYKLKGDAASVFKDPAEEAIRVVAIASARSRRHRAAAAAVAAAAVHTHKNDKYVADSDDSSDDDGHEWREASSSSATKKVGRTE